jgi:hypothetical protein
MRSACPAERRDPAGGKLCVVELLIAVNPDPESGLAYLMRLPLAGGMVLRTSGIWPRTNALYCFPVTADEWPDDPDIVERLALRSCVRRGAAIDLARRPSPVNAAGPGLAGLGDQGPGMSFGKLERVPIMAGARWRHLAAKAVAGVVLAGAAAGCASQSAAAGGSVNSCFQFGVAAIRHQVTATALPPACQGLSQLEVNVALGRALHAAAAGVSGKSRQRQVIGRDSAYLAHLIRGVRSPAQPTAVAPVTHLPSRAALGLAALIAWLVTVGLGLSMMARWITRPARPGTQPGHGRRPVLNFTHFGLALTSLVAWISYLATGLVGLAWTACGLLIAVASLGMTLVFLTPDRKPVPSLATGAVSPPGDEPPPAGHPPALVIAAHVICACVTILLAILAAIGSG